MTFKVEANDHGAMTADDDLVGLAEALAEARSALKAWREREDDLKSQIIERMQGAELAVRGQRGIVRVATVTSHRFDSSAFGSDYPDLYDTYKRPVDSTRVTV